jgi:hypothetical protein
LLVSDDWIEVGPVDFATTTGLEGHGHSTQGA